MGRIPLDDIFRIFSVGYSKQNECFFQRHVLYISELQDKCGLVTVQRVGEEPTLGVLICGVVYKSDVAYYITNRSQDVTDIFIKNLMNELDYYRALEYLEL